jgi:hypothetical protein
VGIHSANMHQVTDRRSLNRPIKSNIRADWLDFTSLPR